MQFTAIAILFLFFIYVEHSEKAASCVIFTLIQQHEDSLVRRKAKNKWHKKLKFYFDGFCVPLKVIWSFKINVLHSILPRQWERMRTANREIGRERVNEYRSVWITHYFFPAGLKTLQNTSTDLQFLLHNAEERRDVYRVARQLSHSYFVDGVFAALVCIRARTRHWHWHTPVRQLTRS